MPEKKVWHGDAKFWASLEQKLGLSSQMKPFQLALHFAFESWALQYVVSHPQGISPFALKKSV